MLFKLAVLLVVVVHVTTAAKRKDSKWVLEVFEASLSALPPPELKELNQRLRLAAFQYIADRLQQEDVDQVKSSLPVHLFHLLRDNFEDGLRLHSDKEAVRDFLIVLLNEYIDDLSDGLMSHIRDAIGDSLVVLRDLTTRESPLRAMEKLKAVTDTFRAHFSTELTDADMDPNHPFNERLIQDMTNAVRIRAMESLRTLACSSPTIVYLI